MHARAVVAAVPGQSPLSRRAPVRWASWRPSEPGRSNVSSRVPSTGNASRKRRDDGEPTTKPLLLGFPPGKRPGQCFGHRFQTCLRRIGDRAMRSRAAGAELVSFSRRREDACRAERDSPRSRTRSRNSHDSTSPGGRQFTVWARLLDGAVCAAPAPLTQIRSASDMRSWPSG